MDPMSVKPVDRNMQRGRLVITAILLIAIVSASLAVWVHYRKGRKALEYWGRDRSLLIRDAESVQLIRLRPQESDRDQKGFPHTIDGRRWAEEARADVSNHSGLLHVRMALLDDQSYDWLQQPKNCRPERLHVLVFQAPADRLEVILDTECRLLRRVGDQRDVSMAPASKFFARWLQQQLP